MTMPSSTTNTVCHDVRTFFLLNKFAVNDASNGIAYVKELSCGGQNEN